MSLGKSQGGSTQGDSASQSMTDQRIFQPQREALESLYSNATSAYSNMMQPFQDQAQRLGNAATFGTMGAAQGLANSQLGEQGQRAQQQLALQGNNANPFLQGQIGGLARDAQQLSQQLLGDVGEGFVSAGQYGGSRQGLAEGQVMEGVLDNFLQQSANLRSGDLDRQLQANTALMQGGLQQQGLQQQGLQASAALMPQLMNLGLSPYTAQMGMLSQLGGILGDPTVLSENRTESQSRTRGRQGDSIGIGLF